MFCVFRPLRASRCARDEPDWRQRDEGRQDLREHLRAGRNLTPEKAESLEAELDRAPENLFARAELVGYYARLFRDRSARTRRHEHVLWLIENAPETNVLDSSEAMITRGLYSATYGEATRLWTEHLERHPNNLAILKNAAQFHTLGDRTTAIQLLERAQALDDLNGAYIRECRVRQLPHTVLERRTAQRPTFALRRR